VFYLVIDTQRSAENVYFLNAVTVADLLALAEMPEIPQGEAAAPPAETVAEPPAEETPPAPETEQGGNNMGMIVLAAAVVILGGGAGWYFKIYRPKRRGAAGDTEYEPSTDGGENDYPGDWDGEGDTADGNMWYDAGDAADDSPPWDGGEREADE
jgi:hypothetical protein